MGTTRTRNPAVFLDRDGTVIREKNYLSKIKDLRLLSGAVAGMKLLKKAGYKLVLITNQSGIGRGYFTEAKLKKIHVRLAEMLKEKGAPLDAIYYCPHLPDDECACRKPKLGLIRKAGKRLNLDLKRSFSVGDHPGDFLLGQNMGGKGIFVLTGHGRKEFRNLRRREDGARPDRVERNLLSAARWIAKRSR